MANDGAHDHGREVTGPSSVSLSRRDLALAVATLLLIATNICSLAALITLSLCRAWTVRTKVIAIAIWLGPSAALLTLAFIPAAPLPSLPSPLSYSLVLFVAAHTSWIIATVMLGCTLVLRGRAQPVTRQAEVAETWTSTR